MNIDKFLSDMLFGCDGGEAHKLLINILEKSLEDEDEVLFKRSGFYTISKMNAEGIEVEVSRYDSGNNNFYWMIWFDVDFSVRATNWQDALKLMISTYAKAERDLDKKVDRYKTRYDDGIKSDADSVDYYRRKVGNPDHIYFSFLYNIVLNYLLSGNKFSTCVDCGNRNSVSVQIVDGKFVVDCYDVKCTYESTMFYDVMKSTSVPQILAVAIVRFLLA